MTGPHLTETERAIYDAARAEALAHRWQVDADLRERDGGDGGQCREFQRRYEGEAAAAWRRLEDLRAQDVPAAAE